MFKCFDTLYVYFSVTVAVCQPLKLVSLTEREKQRQRVRARVFLFEKKNIREKSTEFRFVCFHIFILLKS